MKDLKAAAMELGVIPGVLLHIIDLDVLEPPELIVLGEQGLWTEDTRLGFSRADLDRFGVEVGRRQFVDVIARHPSIRPDAEFLCAPGWTALIEEAAKRLASIPRGSCSGGKEKYGALILYLSPRSGNDAIDALGEEIRSRSLTVCEECGEVGRMRMGLRLCQTLCERHARLVYPLRPEDGVMLDPARGK